MASETRDPREAVLEEALVQAHNHGFASGQGDYGPDEPKGPNILARLDAVDPLRKLLPEVVEALEELVRINEEHNAAVAEVTGKPPSWKDSYLDAARTALTRLQALTTEEPTDG